MCTRRGCAGFRDAQRGGCPTQTRGGRPQGLDRNQNLDSLRNGEPDKAEQMKMAAKQSMHNKTVSPLALMP